LALFQKLLLKLLRPYLFELNFLWVQKLEEHKAILFFFVSFALKKKTLRKEAHLLWFSCLARNIVRIKNPFDKVFFFFQKDAMDIACLLKEHRLIQNEIIIIT
jgi:hypothetical protein